MPRPTISILIFRIEIIFLKIFNIPSNFSYTLIIYMLKFEGPGKRYFTAPKGASW
jgi:hypothetical protein